MPNARHFATWRGFAGFWAFRVIFESWVTLLTGAPTLLRMLEYRHRLIDAAVERHRPDLLIEIAAGFSRRAVTWAADHEVRAVEVDLPHVTAAKRSFIERAGLRDRLGGRHSMVTADALGDGFADELRAIVGSAKRPVVVAEGLLAYFHLDDRLRLLTSIREALEGTEALVLTDIYTHEGRGRTPLGSKALKLAIRLVTRGQGAPESWPDLDAAVATWKQAGFSQVAPLEPLEFGADARPKLSSERAPGTVVAAS